MIDEISMLSTQILMKVNTLFQAVRKSTAPFGGMQVVMSGDFYQVSQSSLVDPGSNPAGSIGYGDDCSAVSLPRESTLAAKGYVHIRNTQLQFFFISYLFIYFYQLKPVPNLRYNDPGQLLVESDDFKVLVPHHFKLTTVHRQDQSETALL